MGDDHSEVAQPMHSLDVEHDVMADVPAGAEVFAHVARRERCCPPVIDGD
ncbi:hypothetical protein [Mycobacterium xenopi]|nr:hypothetical protein [Mycobacterium xenopi]MDA3659273.1 hypothetical protein [Mycobacterium xenopi]